MKFQKIYDCTYYIPSLFYLIPFLFLGVGIFLLINLKNPYLEKRITALIFCVIFIVSGLFSSFLVVSEVIHSYKNIVIPYKNGEYLEIEGEVKDIKITPFLGNGNDTFSVNGVEFEVGNSKPGYQKQAAYGGKITENGQKVRIRYISDNNCNYIMSLEMEE